METCSISDANANRATIRFLVFVVCSLFAKTGLGYVYDSTPFNRSSFPPGFIFGAASAAYQYEGAAFEGGRGPSIWDTYTHKFPDGKLSKGVNKEGIAFYNNVINDLLANGITPFVTLFHWDLPQALEDEYRGFLSHLLIDDFRDFSEFCFKEFGDRVKNWITFNEPFTFTNGGYDGEFLGNLAPGRCSGSCPQGNSSTEPYIVAHHLLLAHAASVQLYRDKYQPTQKGIIGIVLVTHWFVPYSNTTLDIKAAHRALDFVFGWFIHPVVYGSYPRSMVFLVGDRLPKFTKEQSALLKGSFDFLGVNYYTGNYAAHVYSNGGRNLSSTKDSRTRLTTEINGVPIGSPTGVPIFFSYPKGLHDLLVYTKKAYNNPTIYITEAGMGDADNETMANNINDPKRIDFYTHHLHATRQAIEQGVKVKGFIAWSFLDNFEWGSGYTQRFGLCYVDRKNGLKRTPKKSALWFRGCLTKK